MHNLRKPVSSSIIALILFGMSFAVQSATIRVSQESSAGAGDFDANVLGVINSYSSALTAAQYYNYNTSFAASFDDGAQDVTLTSNKSHVFFVDGADGLSVFFVHDKPQDGSGGGAEMTYDLVGDTASVLVRDDNESTGLPSGPTHFETAHAWSPCCTDGMAIGSLDGDWSLFAEFDSFSTPRSGTTFTWADFDGACVSTSTRSPCQPPCGCSGPRWLDLSASPEDETWPSCGTRFTNWPHLRVGHFIYPERLKLAVVRAPEQPVSSGRYRVYRVLENSRFPACRERGQDSRAPHTPPD